MRSPVTASPLHTDGPTDEPPFARRLVILLLYVVFIVSGAAGLIYESIWSRYLGLFVGHTAYAQIIVLVIFLGGMSAGAWLVGRRSERLRDPLLWYAGVELIVGLIGLFFHEIYVGVTGVAYDAIFPALAGGPLLLVAKWGIAALLILPQSVLLGATFPLMSAGVLRRAESRGASGRVLSLLYFANSLGAAAGVLLAGFVLIAAVGLPGTLLTAAALNIGVAAVTYLAARATSDAWAPALARRQSTPPAADGLRTEEAPTGDSVSGGAPRAPIAVDAHPATPAPAPTPSPAASPRLERLWRLLLLVSFGTAVSSFIYEIAWIRMLSLVLGSATHSFELMLSAFILGLALGAFWVRSRADRFADPVRTLAVVQWVMGLLAVATLPVYIASFGWMAWLLAALDETVAGYRAFTLSRYLIALAVMLPATFCAGVTLPLITRTLLHARRDGGALPDERAIGAVYGVNTLGSIVGAALAGLALMPLLGLEILLIAGSLVDMALAALLFVFARGDARAARRPLAILAAATALFVVLVAWRTRFDPGVLASGVYRYGTAGTPGATDIVFYRDGRTATVSGRVGANLNRSISTNGKPDASLSAEWYGRPGARPEVPLAGDASTQALLPLITLAHAPRPRTAAVIGHGSGMTSHFLLGDPRLERVSTIEIEPEMIRGALRVFYPANARVYDDPRAEFVVDDAKSHFAAAGRRYDIIISEPSNPWVSGVSGLFTQEFYARVRRYLSDDGVFGQWLHLYEIDDSLVLSVIAALHENFPSYQIFRVARGDILIVAGLRPSLPAPDWSVLRQPGIASDLSRFVPLAPEALERTHLLDRATLTPLMDVGRRPNSDFYPLLDLGAERTRYLRNSAIGFNMLGQDRLDVVATLAGRRVPFGTMTRESISGVPALFALTSGARLRASSGGPSLPYDSTGTPADTTGYAARFRRDAFERGLAGARPPASWPHWTQEALRVEQDLHGGTAGVADERFYGAVYAFLRATDAPPEARAAIDFRHGLASWDFAKASGAADTLAAALDRGEGWVSAAELRDGAVVARLRLGDVAGARRVYDALVQPLSGQRDDLRSWLVAAHLIAAERRARPREVRTERGSDSAARDSVPGTGRAP